MEQQSATFEGWVILELMGHRRLAGYVREQQIGGASFLRIDVPGQDGTQATQFYAPSSVYAITPTTERMARAVADPERVAPVQEWELPQLRGRELPAVREEIPDFDEHDDEIEDPRVVLDEWIRDSSLAKVLDDLKDAVAPHEPGHPELERQVAIIEFAKTLVEMGESSGGVLSIGAARAHHLERGYTAAHDDAEEASGTLGAAAGWLLYCADTVKYLSSNSPGWADDLIREHKSDPIELLTHAGSLIAAEIDRLKRQSATAPAQEPIAVPEPAPIGAAEAVDDEIPI